MHIGDLKDVGLTVGFDPHGYWLTVATPSNYYYFETRAELCGFVSGYLEGREAEANAQPATIPMPVVSAATVKDALCQVIDRFQGGTIPQVS
jgi:hypothetical protein